MKYEHLIDLAIIDALYSGSKRYGELKQLAENFLTKTIAEEAFDSHMKTLKAENIIDKKGARRYDPYVLTEAARRKHQLNLLHDPNTIRQKMYQVLFFTQIESEILSGKQPGFTMGEVYDNLERRNFTFGDHEYTEYSMAKIFEILQHEGLIREHSTNADGMKGFVISNHWLYVLVREVWSVYHLQFAMLSLVWGHERRPNGKEREKLEQFLGVDKTQELVDDFALDRIRFKKKPKEEKIRELAEIRRKEIRWNEMIKGRFDKLDEYCKRLGQTHDIPQELVTSILFYTKPLS